MNNVLSHPAFAREPVVNARRRGPCAKPVTHLHRYRREKYGWVTTEQIELRQWADAHGMSGTSDYEEIREKKTLADTHEALMKGQYGDALRDIENMKLKIAELFSVVRNRERRMLDQANRERIAYVEQTFGIDLGSRR